MKNLILSFATCSLLLISCGKEGCTDKVATNFDSKAKKDNNTCAYSAKAVMWFNQASSDQASSDEFKKRGVNHLDIYLNNILTTTIPTSTFFSSAPDCETGGAGIIEKSLGNTKSQNFRFIAKDPFGFIIYDNVLEMKAGACMAVELGK
jgi:hypothetical protein